LTARRTFPTALVLKLRNYDKFGLPICLRVLVLNSN
jgi:hypothetical protein